MRLKRGGGLACIARADGLENRPVFLHGQPVAKSIVLHFRHVIHPKRVKGGLVGPQQQTGSAGLHERAVKLPVLDRPAADKGRDVRDIHHLLFHMGQLAVGGRDSHFPVEVSVLQGQRKTLLLKQQPHMRRLTEGLPRKGHRSKAKVALRQDQAFSGQPQKRLTQDTAGAAELFLEMLGDKTFA